MKQKDLSKLTSNLNMEKWKDLQYGVVVDSQGSTSSLNEHRDTSYQ